MEYLAIAYGLIAVVLIGYGVSLWQRAQAVRRERARLEAEVGSETVGQWDSMRR